MIAWHYHDDDVAGPEAAVQLTVAGLPAAARQVRLTHYRIDEEHSNAYAAWKRMGSPIAPTRQQYDELEAASRLALLEEPRVRDRGRRDAGAHVRAATSGGLARDDRVGIGLPPSRRGGRAGIR